MRGQQVQLRIGLVNREGKLMKLQCLEATDSNGTELYLFQLEDNSFISVPKERLEFKPLSPEELKEMKGADDERVDLQR